MLVFPTLAHPARHADKSTAPTRPIRDVIVRDIIVPPNAMPRNPVAGVKLRQGRTKRAVTINPRTDCCEPLQNYHVSAFFDLRCRSNPGKRSFLPSPYGIRRPHHSNQ